MSALVSIFCILVYCFFSLLYSTYDTGSRLLQEAWNLWDEWMIQCLFLPLVGCIVECLSGDDCNKHQIFSSLFSFTCSMYFVSNAGISINFLMTKDKMSCFFYIENRP